MPSPSPVCVVIAGVGGLGSELLAKLESTKSWRGRPVDLVVGIDFIPSEAKVAKLRERLSAAFPKSAAIHWDASQIASTEAVGAQLADTLAGRPVDVLIVTTGLGFHGHVTQTPLGQTNKVLQRLLQINCTGPALLTQLVATRHMPAPKNADAPPPTILAMSSFSGLVGLPDRAAYCASKFALNGWLEGLYADLRHLRIVLMCPTTVDTGFRDNWKRQLGGGSGSAASSSAAGSEAQAAAAAPAKKKGPSLWQRFSDGKSELTVQECVAGIWRALNEESGPGVKYDVVKGFWSDTAQWSVRTWFLGDYARYRVLLKAGKL